MSIDNPNGSVTLHRRREDENTAENCPKRRKFRDLLAERSHLSTSTPEEVKLDKDMTHKDYVIMVLLSVFIYWLLSLVTSRN